MQVPTTELNIDSRAQNSDTLEAKHFPGEAGIWILVLGEACMFGLFFITFLAYRSQDVALFQSSQDALNIHFGAINTLLLLVSSWCVVIALKLIREHRDAIASRLINAALLCGSCFAAIKIAEYSIKVSDGITPLSNSFYMYYFVLTGIHFVHLLIGLGVLLYMRSLIYRPGSAASHLLTLENGATFWHLVDLLWIVLFPLLYLLN